MSVSLFLLRLFILFLYNSYLGEGVLRVKECKLVPFEALDILPVYSYLGEGVLRVKECKLVPLEALYILPLYSYLG
jgi:hypothetical protein